MAKHGALEHPKTKRLARALNTIPGVALGILETVWHWVADYRKDGALSAIDLEDALDSGGWLTMFKASDVIAAMTDEARECVLLEPMGDGRYYVHDWHTHADDAVNRSLARAILTFANGVRPSFNRLEQKERERISAAYDALNSDQDAPVVEPESTLGARQAHNMRTVGREPKPKPCINPPTPQGGLENPVEEKPKRKRQVTDHSEGIPIPERLTKVQGFEKAWGLRCAQRFAVPKTRFPTPASVEAELGILLKCHDPVAVLNNAIAGGWQGLNAKKWDFGGPDDGLQLVPGGKDPIGPTVGLYDPAGTQFYVPESDQDRLLAEGWTTHPPPKEKPKVRGDLKSLEEKVAWQ